MTKIKTTEFTFITYFVVCVCFVCIRILAAFNLFAGLGQAGVSILSASMQIGLFLIAIFMFSALQKQKPKDTFRFYGYKKISPLAIVFAIIIGVLVYFFNIFIASIFDTVLKSVGYVFVKTAEGDASTTMLFVNLLTVAILPAICEETLHRGLLLKGGSAMGMGKALVVSALLFGLLHCNIEQFFYATILGLFMGYLSVICDSIYPAMIVHFVNNALGVLYSFTPFSKFMDMSFNFMLGNGILGYLFTIILLGLLGWLLFVLVKRLFLETTGKNLALMQAEMYKEIAKNDYLQSINSAKSELGDNTREKPNYEKMYLEKNIKLGLMTELDKELMSDTKFKHSALSLTFMIASFVLIGGMTLFDFIQGVLRGFGIIC